MSEAISWFEEVWPMIKKTRVSYITPHIALRTDIDVALSCRIAGNLKTFAEI